MGVYFSFYFIAYQAGGSTETEVMNRIVSLEANYMWIKAVYPCVNLLLITIILITMISRLRRDLQSIFYQEYLQTAGKVSLEQLKMYTIEVKSKGTNFDLNSKELKHYLQAELRKLGYSDRIWGCIIVPDYSKLIELEAQRSELFVDFDQIEGYQPLFKCLAAKELQSLQGFQQKLRLLDVYQDAAICQPLLGSFTAFMMLDNLKAVAKISNKFA